VLTAEGNDWLKCDNLAERVDIYLANHTHEGRPKHFKNAGITTPGKANFSTPEAQASRKWNAGNGNSRNGGGNANANGRTVQEHNVAKSANNISGGNKNKGLCYSCQSPDHRQFNCPLRSGQVTSGGQSSAGARTPMARNFACAVETRDTVTGPDKGEGTPRALTETAVVVQDDPINRDEPVEATSSSQVRTAAVHRHTTGGTVRPEAGRRAEAVFHSAHAAIGEVDATDSGQLNTHSFSKLTYIPVCIQGIPSCHDALHDSGSQVNLIKRDLLRQLPNMPSVGRISIKGIVGSAIETDLVSLNIKPTPTDSDCINIAPPLTEVFAVCDELNEGIILTADAVKRLTALSEYDNLIAANTVTVTETSDGTAEATNDVDAVTVDLRADADDDRDCIDAPSSSHAETDLKSADTATLIKEQSEDVNFTKYFDMAKNGNKLFFVRDGILYRRGKCRETGSNNSTLSTRAPYCNSIEASARSFSLRTSSCPTDK